MTDPPVLPMAIWPDCGWELLMTVGQVRPVVDIYVFLVVSPSPSPLGIGFMR